VQESEDEGDQDGDRKPPGQRILPLRGEHPLLNCRNESGSQQFCGGDPDRERCGDKRGAGHKVNAWSGVGEAAMSKLASL
jgi:hypothetical protein